MVEADIRALGVVGAQHAGHEHKCIEETALGQGQTNWQGRFAGAQAAVLNVGVGDRRIVLGGIGFNGDALKAIAAGLPGELV